MAQNFETLCNFQKFVVSVKIALDMLHILSLDTHRIKDFHIDISDTIFTNNDKAQGSASVKYRYIVLMPGSSEFKL